MKWVAIISIVVLLGLNILQYGASVLDRAITNTYVNDQHQLTDSMRKQLMAITPGLASGKRKEEIVAIAEAGLEETSFEKEGCTWVGRIGFKFDEEGRLIHVSQGWSFGEPDPCYPRP